MIRDYQKPAVATPSVRGFAIGDRVRVIAEQLPFKGFAGPVLRIGRDYRGHVLYRVQVAEFPHGVNFHAWELEAAS